MAIIAVLAGVLVPSLSAFATGRRLANAASQVLTLANYARAQAISKGDVYRINFDASGAGAVWLTVQTEGQFAAVPGDFGARYAMPDGVRLSAQVTPGTVIVPVANPNVQTATVTPTPMFGTDVATPNTLTQVTRTDGGTYVEIQPSGRTDPCHIRLTDNTGRAIDLGAATATDVLHALKPGEM
jgi:Tfp pilus assembly protein FimT